MSREATLSVSLTNPLKTYIREKVDSGQFESASEVIRQSLRTMQEQEQRERLYWSDLRKKVKEARRAITKGDVVDDPEFMRRKIAALKSQADPRTSRTKRKKRS